MLFLSSLLFFYVSAFYPVNAIALPGRMLLEGTKLYRGTE